MCKTLGVVNINKVPNNLRWDVFVDNLWSGVFWHGAGDFWWVAEHGVIGQKFPANITETKEMGEFGIRANTENRRYIAHADIFLKSVSRLTFEELLEQTATLHKKRGNKSEGLHFEILAGLQRLARQNKGVKVTFQSRDQEHVGFLESFPKDLPCNISVMIPGHHPLGISSSWVTRWEAIASDD